MKKYLAVDIGASSGRHIIGWTENGEIRTEEVYRFPNGVTEKDGHLTWDIKALLSHVEEGIEKALEIYPQIESLSIDTWAVDYVLQPHPLQPRVRLLGWGAPRSDSVWAFCGVALRGSHLGGVPGARWLR